MSTARDRVPRLSLDTRNDIDLLESWIGVTESWKTEARVDGASYGFQTIDEAYVAHAGLPD